MPQRLRRPANWWDGLGNLLGGAHINAEMAQHRSSWLRVGQDGFVRIKLALEGPRWHSHLGGWHAILTTSVVDRVLHAVGQAQFATN